MRKLKMLLLGLPVLMLAVPVWAGCPQDGPYTSQGGELLTGRASEAWVGGGEGWLVGVDGSARQVSRVPARAVPTRGGPVRDDGALLLPTQSGNDSVLEVVYLDGWVAFGEIGFVDVSEVDYTL